MSPQNVNNLNDFAPNGWEEMKLHKLNQTMQQKDKFLAECLNNIRQSVPKCGSREDIMLKNCEVQVSSFHPHYPTMLCMYILKTFTVMNGMIS